MADVQPTSHDKASIRSPWGLHPLNDGTSKAREGETTVDIIAVHGLGANPDHAWVRHKDTTAGLEKDVQWLTDLLPQTFHDHQPSISARIFCFNYQSAWLGPHLTRNRLEGLAGRLLNDIHNARDENGAVPDRPLIFVGHSFGGLVIEQAVVQANSAGGIYEYLVKRIGGVILLGTPHRGSGSQKWGLIVANLANLINYGETALMKDVDEKSMKIFDLVSAFNTIMIGLDLAKTAVICFYENRPTNYVSRVIRIPMYFQRNASAIVVDETSATLPGFKSIVLDSDHLKLNKFPGAQDGNYKSVSSNLCRIAAEAPDLIRRRQEGMASSRDRHFLVSRERVKDFIGRDSLLDQIRSHFSHAQSGSPLILVLHALGGQGKSQIALEYCRKWRETYRGVFWIDAKSAITVTQSYGAIAAELTGGSHSVIEDSAAQIKLVKGQLERWNEPWLLVYDNYDEPDKFSEVRQFIPTKGHGHVLFTSRARDLGRIGTLLEIPPMTTEEGVRLLLRGYDDSEIQQRHKDTALSIINRLGRLALAIDQAAAYIKYIRMPLNGLSHFLITYEAERKRILSYIPKKFWEYREMQSHGEVKDISAFTTWEMSFQQLWSGDDPWRNDAGRFLSLSAFFAPTSITESLFQYYEEYGGEKNWITVFSVADEFQGDESEESGKEDNEDNKADKLSSGGKSHRTWHADRYWDLIAKADELSLLQSISPGMGRQGASFSLHPLIRDWLQLRLKAKQRQEYTQEAIRVLVCCARAYKARSATLEEMRALNISMSNERESLEPQNRRALKMHMDMSMSNEREFLEPEERRALIMHMDMSMSNEREFLEPQDRLGRSIASCYGATWFANFYFDQGRYRMSEKLYRQMTETRRNLLGEGHPSTLKSMYNLALALKIQAKYEEAEAIQRQTLALRKTVLGDDHIDTLTSAHNLADLLNLVGHYEESSELHRQTLKTAESVLGEDHSQTLMCLKDLALVLNHRKNYEESELILRQILKTRERVSGKEHPETLKIMGSLAMVLSNQSKHEEAERVFRSTLVMAEKVFGKEHPDTMRCMNNLAMELRRQMRYEEAEQHMRETWELRESVLGKEHPDTLKSMEDLAWILEYQGKNEEAEQMFSELAG